MRSLRVSLLVDAATVPSEDPQLVMTPEDAVTEYHVATALRWLGHEVTVLPVGTDLPGMLAQLEAQKPQIVFNLTEVFDGDRCQDKNIAAVLEMVGVPFTGTGSTGLMLARDKALSKQLLSLHKIRVPGFLHLPMGRRVRSTAGLKFPVIVKPALEDGSVGIHKTSVVQNAEELRERAQFIHERLRQAAIAEEYIEGRELYVALLGNKQLTVLPPREILFNSREDGGPALATYRVKWDKEYRRRWDISFDYAALPPDVLQNVARVCKRVYRIMQLRDYGRIDLRLTASNRLVILEVNPNPDIAFGEEVADAAEKHGIAYEELIDRILRLTLRRHRG